MGQIVEENYTNGLKIYYDTDDPKHFYGRIVGGIGWRGKRPGFICVVGEDLEKDKTLDEYHLWILREYENFDTKKLLEKCLEFRDFSCVKGWYGDADNELEMDYLEKVNFPIPCEYHLRIDWAPHSDDPKAFEFCLDIIERGLNPHKLLHFGKSKVREYLNEINQENRGSFNVGDYPAITALGSALEYLKTHAPDVTRGIDYDIDEQRNRDYNPLTHGL